MVLQMNDRKEKSNQSSERILMSACKVTLSSKDFEQRDERLEQKIDQRSDGKETSVDTAMPFDILRSGGDLTQPHDAVSIGTELASGLEVLPRSRTKA